MNKDHNIDDMVMRLKNSVEGRNAEEIEFDGEEARVSENISEEVLKKQLRDQYMGELSEREDNVFDESEDDYALDDEFLKEAVIDDGSYATEELNDEPENVESESDETEDIIQPDAEEAEEEQELYESQEELGEIVVDEDEEHDVYEIIQQPEDDVEEQDEDESLFESGEADEDIEARAENTNTEALVASMIVTATDEEVSQITADEDENILEDAELIDVDVSEADTETYDDLVFSSDIGSYEDDLLDEALGAESSSAEEFDSDDINDYNDASEENSYILEENRTSLKELLTERNNDIYIEENIVDDEEKDDLSSSEYGGDYSYNSEQEEEKEGDLSLPDDVTEIDDSVFDIMMQMGCYKEAKASLKRNVSEQTANEAEDISVKESKREQELNMLEDTLYDYQSEKSRGLMRLVGVGIITVLLFFYELLPIFDVPFKGIFDYENYPVAYSLVGLQLVVFDIIIMYRRLWKGIRSLFTTDRSVDNVVSLVVGTVVLYDILALFGVSETMPIAFNFIISFLMLLVCIDEFVSVSTKIKGCEILLSDISKYEFSKCARFGGVAEKMYRGGYSTERNVFTINGTDKIKMYARDIAADEKLISKKTKVLLIPSFVLAAVMSMISIMLEGEFVSAVGSFMITLLLMLPIGDVVTNLTLHTYTRYKLTKKGSIVNVQKAIDSFKTGDSVVFSDLHLFRKCQPKNMGIVFFRNGQEALVVRSLTAVCAAIGGPMSELFADAAEKLQPAEVRINKIWHNGIDAFIDRRYSFLMGDAKFFEKYGIQFPENKDKTVRDGVTTLCVAIGGLPACKVSIKYEIEPMFEVIAERLYECGISTVIETYDPLINSSFVMACRNMGAAPINVVHKNIADRDGTTKEIVDRDGRGILSCSSRLKLAEALVWCRKIISIRRLSGIFSCVIAVLGLLLSLAATVLGIVGEINEFLVFAYLAATLLVSFLAINKDIPKKTYFTAEALRRDIQKKIHKKQRSSKK